MTIDDVKALLPHREPFLFLDGVVAIDTDSVEAYRDIRPDESFFRGHFPGNPVFPGVLIVEAIAQAGILVVLARLGGRDGKATLFAAIERARFRRVVRPGERLRLFARVVGEKAGVFKIEGRALVGDELACEALVTGALR
uniref:3-hydroxyacyl-[acyl-carrier-protein] dehydratase n=1 Tax=candidate division WOR-3 bacterium TaxID=2052148 RepID=A0A7C4GJ13_UNCW3